MNTDSDTFYSDDIHTHKEKHYLYWILVSAKYSLNSSMQVMFFFSSYV